MAKPKAVMWLFIVTGVLWILAGIRDLFAPGFFSFSGRAVSNSTVTLNLAIGIVFLIIGSSQAARIRNRKNKGLR